jgi:tetratricopeptide (TPR) repeat protein
MSLTRRKIFAVAALAAVLGGCSRSPEQNFQRAVAYYQEGKYAKAADCLEQALAKAPPTPQALTLLGVCRLKSGRSDSGGRSFNEALKLDLNYTPARYNLALLQLEHGQFESAANLLRQVHQKPGAPADAGAYLALACNNLAVTAARQRDFQRADKLLCEALAADPKSAEVTRNVAELKTRTEPPKQVAKTATVVATTNVAPKQVAVRAPTTPATQAVHAAKSTPPVPLPQPGVKRRASIAPRTLTPGNRAQASLHFDEASSRQQQGRLTGVVELYEKAIAADPSFAQAYYNLANACRDLRQPARALDNYELALMADPKFSSARRNYAILLQEQGYIADSLDQYETILQSEPNDAAVHVTVAGLYAADRTTLAKARQHYEAYLKLVPNAPHATEIRRWLEKNR